MQDIEAAIKAYTDFLTALGIDRNAGIDVADNAKNTAILMAKMMHGSQEDAPESSFITFTSDDGSVEGRIDCFALGASFYASVSDDSIVNTNETYEFTFKY